jgi:hypothetical protein
MAVIKVRWTVKPEDLTNILTLFNTQKVYRSTTGSTGPWVEITSAPTRVALVAGTYDYYFDDTTGSATYYYCTAFYHSTSLLEGDKSTAIDGDFTDVAYLSLSDLYSLVGQARVLSYFDDNGNGSLDDSHEAVRSALAGAEAEAAAYLRRSWNSTEIIALVQSDRALRRYVSWIALKYAAERRPEFMASDGKGPYQDQYERAIAYCDGIGKGKLGTLGSDTAGIAGRTGGVYQPERETDEAKFTFAPDNNYPYGHGGF